MRHKSVFLLPFCLFFCSCSIYQSRFQEGGELTTDFLDRIQEHPKGEDILLPPKEQSPC